jgi:hypothetical protein
VDQQSTPDEAELDIKYWRKWTVSQWVSYVWQKTFAALLIALIFATINLFLDNADHNKDLAELRWRQDRDDEWKARIETRVERNDGAIGDLYEKNAEFAEFPPILLDRMGELKELIARDKRGQR